MNAFCHEVGDSEMGLITLIKNWLERRGLQKRIELEEKRLHQRILKKQLGIAKLTLKEMKRDERFERRVNNRKPKDYIC